MKYFKYNLPNYDAYYDKNNKYISYEYVRKNKTFVYQNKIGDVYFFNNNEYHNKKGAAIIESRGKKRYYFNNKSVQKIFKSNKEYRKYIKLLAFQ